MMATLATAVFLNAAMKQMVAALLTVAADHPRPPEVLPVREPGPTSTPREPGRHHSRGQEPAPEQHGPDIGLDALGEDSRRAPCDRRQRDEGVTEHDLLAAIVNHDDLRVR